MKEQQYNVFRTLIFDGQVSLTLADTTDVVREAIRLHRLSKPSACVLGKALSVMTFASAALNMEQGEISLSLQSDGLGGNMGVSGNFDLRLRGYIDNPQAQGSEQEVLGKNGALTIVRDDGYRRPFVGTCALPAVGGVDAAFEEYYAKSEQLPTFIQSCVEMDEQGNCTFAGVAVMQPLPFAEDDVLGVSANFPLNELLEDMQKMSLEAVATAHFTTNEQANGYKKAEYKCNCSKHYLSRVLATINQDELRAIVKEDGAVRVHCHYCNTDYAFDETDIDALCKK